MPTEEPSKLLECDTRKLATVYASSALFALPVNDGKECTEAGTLVNEWGDLAAENADNMPCASFEIEKGLFPLPMAASTKKSDDHSGFVAAGNSLAAVNVSSAVEYTDDTLTASFMIEKDVGSLFSDGSAILSFTEEPSDYSECDAVTSSLATVDTSSAFSTLPENIGKASTEAGSIQQLLDGRSEVTAEKAENTPIVTSTENRSDNSRCAAAENTAAAVDASSALSVLAKTTKKASANADSSTLHLSNERSNVKNLHG